MVGFEMRSLAPTLFVLAWLSGLTVDSRLQLLQMSKTVHHARSSQ